MELNENCQPKNHFKKYFFQEHIIKINNIYAFSQALTNVLLTRSAESGQMFTPPPRICVNKSGLTPMYIPLIQKHQDDACSSGSMGQTLTRR